MKKPKLHSPQEIELLINLSISVETSWNVLLATTDERLISVMRQLFIDDKKVHIENVAWGCDALISCVKNNPDLLIIDEKLPDIPCAPVIQSLKRNDTLKDIMIFCNLPSDTTKPIPDLRADDYIVNYDMEKVYLLRKKSILDRAALMQTSQTDIRGTKHERRWPRTKLNIVAKIELFYPDGSEPIGQGDALVENISCGGMCLSSITLHEGLIPEENYLIKLTIDNPPLINWEADSQVVRNRDHEQLGIQFVRISKDDQLKICSLFDK